MGVAGMPSYAVDSEYKQEAEVVRFLSVDGIILHIWLHRPSHKNLDETNQGQENQATAKLIQPMQN